MKKEIEVFIDESFADINIMTATVGLRAEVEECIKITRGWIRKKNKNTKNKKDRIELNEIKDYTINTMYPMIKEMILDNLSLTNLNNKKRQALPREIDVFAVTINKKEGENQTKVYRILAIELIKEIISYYDQPEIIINFDVFFDSYGEKLFREKLYKELAALFPNKKITLQHVPSQGDQGIQVADIVTGTIRRYLLDETGTEVYFDKIKSKIKIIKRLEI